MHEYCKSEGNGRVLQKCHPKLNGVFEVADNHTSDLESFDLEILDVVNDLMCRFVIHQSPIEILCLCMKMEKHDLLPIPIMKPLWISKSQGVNMSETPSFEPSIHSNVRCGANLARTYAACKNLEGCATSTTWTLW